MTTPSSNKQMIINTRERAVSNDINRLQAFSGADAAEIARYLHLGATFAEHAFGVPAFTSAIANPLKAIFLSGGCALPQAASTDLFVGPSACWVVYPDASPSADDSGVKLVIDPGVNTPGTLSFLAVGASTRIDVVEVQPVLTVIETSNRDIYNPATGLFAATTVDKVQVLRWSYRIRRGSEGSGFPGTSLGWLPIMVASIPLGATNWDSAGVICWDVRPLMVDLVSKPCDARDLDESHPRDLNFVVGFEYDVDSTIGTNKQSWINGTAEWEANGRIVGGKLPANGINTKPDGDFSEPGFWASLGANSTWHLYACFPFNLPRWARYNPATRLPGAFRGVAVASIVGINSPFREPLAPLAMPTNSGLGVDTTTNATAVVSGYSAVAKLIAECSESEWVEVAPDVNTKFTLTYGGRFAVGTDTIFIFDLVEGTNVPIGVKGVDLDVTMNWSSGGAASTTMVSADLYVTTQAYHAADFGNFILIPAAASIRTHASEQSGGGNPMQIGGTFRLALPPSFPGPSAWAPRTWRIGLFVTSGTSTLTNGINGSGVGRAVVRGFRF